MGSGARGSGISGIEALAAGEALLKVEENVEGDFMTPLPLEALSVSAIWVVCLVLCLKRPMTGVMSDGGAAHYLPYVER